MCADNASHAVQASVAPSHPQEAPAPHQNKNAQALFTGLLIAASAVLQTPTHWAALAFGCLGLVAALTYLIVAHSRGGHGAKR